MNSSYLRSEDLCSIPLRTKYLHNLTSLAYKTLLLSPTYLPNHLFRSIESWIFISYFMLECNAIYLVQFFPVLGTGSSFIGFWVPLAFLYYCKAFLNTFLFLSTIRYNRSSWIFHLSPRFSHLSEESYTLLLENHIRNQVLNVRSFPI